MSRKRCPECKQTIPDARAYVRHCGKCGLPIELHHKWIYVFKGKNVQMQHRQCDFPTQYLTDKQYEAKYGEKRA